MKSVTTCLVISIFAQLVSGLGEELLIVGGRLAAPNEMKYMASIRYNHTLHFCGGSVISSNKILTAAHCINGVISLIDYISVVVGSNTLNSLTGTEYKVTSMKMHEAFNPDKASNDLGMITVAGPIIFNNNVQKIEIDTKIYGSGVSLVISGWGYTSYNPTGTPTGQVSNKLKVLDATSISTLSCFLRLFPSNYPILFTNICTLDNTGEGVCFGDSGSPLVNPQTNKQVGIVSFARPCAQGSPDVYTRVSSYYQWIQDN